MAEFKKLSPAQAASIANIVYQVETSRDVEDVFSLSKVADQFDFGGTTTKRVEARAGAFQFKTKSGFGVISRGVGDFEGDALIACRGTAGIHDVLTDINTGVQPSKTGYAVHAGFNRTFNDFRNSIDEFLRVHKPKRVHCVGHSLGGALATLSADFVRHKGKEAALYTFGSPRVGFAALAKGLSQSPLVGTNNIHRVYHSGDPVSMLPLWPFVHVPQPVGECYISKFMDFNPAQHLMKNYIKSVKGHEGWGTLRNPQPNWDSHVEKWINAEAAGKYFGLNAFNIMMALGAIRLAIHKVIQLGFTAIGLVAVGGMTLLDGLSQMLDKAANISVDSNNFVMRIMQRVLQMLGVSVEKSQKLTHTFIRFVLEKLSFAINRSVVLALTLATIPM